MGGASGLKIWNNPIDPMTLKTAGDKTLEQCVIFRDENCTVYSDNVVKVMSYDGFYEYYLDKERELSQIQSLPIDGFIKDEEYYNNLVNELSLEYNKQIETTPNIYRNKMILKNIIVPAGIYFACSTFRDGTVYVGEGYPPETPNKPSCPVNVPSGKMSILTNATRATHSFVFKDYKFYNIGAGNANRFLFDSLGQFLITSANTNATYDILYSTQFKNCELQTFNPTKEGLILANGRETGYFKQFLIYKGNLTETELKAENDKNIELK